MTTSATSDTATEQRVENLLAFPTGFVWGAATAAYQIEGAAAEDGRTLSIWDTFSHEPGHVLHGDTGDLACDHYHRWPGDVDLLSHLGVGAYRFSISWPRVQPGGRGGLNAAGIAFYDRLLDALLERGVTPWATLYHWDLPQELQDAGGWPERQTAQRFADYAELVRDRLGDRVGHWITLNEPWCSAFLGYAAGIHAPGIRDDAASVRAAHHLLLGHGLAVERLRPTADDATKVGITLNLYPVAPASQAATDQDAARRIGGLHNRIFLDPLLRGAYPADVVEDLGGVSYFGHVADGDLATIGAPLDFLGVNYYSPHTVAGPGPDAADSPTGPSPYPGSHDVRFVPQGGPVTAMGWEVDSGGLHRLLTGLDRDYRLPPVYVTENGAAYDDRLIDGQVRDTDRIGYLDGHLRAARAAIVAGVDLRGYFVWSLLDNFEWALGYTRRFGIVYVDYASLRRTPKASAEWYRGVIAGNGLPASPY